MSRKKRRRSVFTRSIWTSTLGRILGSILILGIIALIFVLLFFVPDGHLWLFLFLWILPDFFDTGSTSGVRNSKDLRD